jgi:hypothetical protein
MPFKKSTLFSVDSADSSMMFIAEVAGACAGIGCGFGSMRVVFATSGASPTLIGSAAATGAGAGALLVEGEVVDEVVACFASVG